jgi:hypothetical protein
LPSFLSSSSICSLFLHLPLRSPIQPLFHLHASHASLTTGALKIERKKTENPGMTL